MSAKLQTELRLDFLRLKGGCSSSSEPTLVKMPHFGNHMSRLLLFLLLRYIIYLIPESSSSDPQPKYRLLNPFIFMKVASFTASAPPT